MTKGGVSTEAIVGTYTNNMVILGMNQRKERNEIGPNELGGSWYDRVQPYRKDDRKYTIG